MSKTIVLEPFNDWHVAGDTSPYLARTSDRHEIRLDFDHSIIYVHLRKAEDATLLRTLNSFGRENLWMAVQFVDKYIDSNYLPAADASRLLREADFREKSLQQQVAQLQASAVGQA